MVLEALSAQRQFGPTCQCCNKSAFHLEGNDRVLSVFMRMGGLGQSFWFSQACLQTGLWLVDELTWADR